MALSDKTEHAKLYFCAGAECRVVTFKPASRDAFCPMCGEDGTKLREPTAARAGIRG